MKTIMTIINQADLDQLNQSIDEGCPTCEGYIERSDNSRLTLSRSNNGTVLGTHEDGSIYSFHVL